MNSPRMQMVLLSLLAMTMACSSTPPVREIPETASFESEIQRVEAALKTAQDQQVEVLSPKNFTKAMESLDNAKSDRNHNKDQKVILHDVAVSQAYLDKATEVAKVAGQVMPGVINARHGALVAEAPKYLPKEFHAAEDDLRSLSADVEENDTASAEKHRGKLEMTYNDLELRSIKQAKLGEAKASFEQAVKEGAKKLTPQILSWAQRKISQDEATIAANLHNTAVVDSASADAKAAGARLLNLVRLAKNVKSENPEQVAAKIENDQIGAKAAADAAATKLGQKDSELGQKDSELQTEKERLAAVAAQNQKLEEKGRFEKEYESARQTFSPSEAEVYKQGDKLLLRLKGLSFANNQSVITPNNYPLLAKVQKVLKDVGSGEVVVEGHTDSIGTADKNEKLSSERAKAVESYLVSNNSVPETKITAMGFGDAKPIATNKTKAGRAQNRRVDVIISSDQAHQSTDQADQAQ